MLLDVARGFTIIEIFKFNVKVLHLTSNKKKIQQISLTIRRGFQIFLVDF